MKMLIKRHTSYDMTLFSEALSCIAANIEDAYILSGAVAEKNYTYKDLMSLAMTYLSSTEHGKSFHTDTTRFSE